MLKFNKKKITITILMKYLNTSHVKVQYSTSVREQPIILFKYISC